MENNIWSDEALAAKMSAFDFDGYFANQTKTNNMFILADENRGIYAISHASNWILNNVEAINPEAVDILSDCINDVEFSQDDLEALEWVFEMDGTRYAVEQDGDVWAIAVNLD